MLIPVAREGGAANLPELSFAGTGIRLASGVATVATNTFSASDLVVGMPDHAVSEGYLYFPAFYCATSAEIKGTSVVTIEGVAVSIGGVWQTANFNKGGGPVTVNPATENGKWVHVSFANPIPANAMATFRVAQQIAAGTLPRTRIRAGATTERIQNSAKTLIGTLAGGTLTNNSSFGALHISSMIWKGADRPSVFVLGDSIGFGQNQAISAASFTARNTFGFLEIGLDDNTRSRRIPSGNWCLPGWSPQLHSDPVACAMQIDMMQQAVALNGGRAPFSFMICEHGTNSIGASTEAALAALYALWGAIEFGNAIPIMQSAMLPYPQTTDGFATFGNQSPFGSNNTLTGARWQINDKLVTLAAPFNVLDSRIEPWRISSFDSAANRALIKLRPFATTLAANWTTGSIIQTVSAPDVGECLIIGTTSPQAGVVIGVSGSGPFTVTLAMTTTSFVAKSAGEAVQASWHDGPVQGLHPSPKSHREYAEAVIDWKLTKGW